jgi:hypothetical protein
MINVHYQKRKNLELFKSLEDPNLFYLTNTQNYIPIYNRFFSLNDTNFNGINLNNKYYISSVINKLDDHFHLYKCKIKNAINNKIKEKKVFFKLAPLLDPYKYLVGKYNINDEKIFTLPSLNSTEEHCHPKLIDHNNSAYVDGLFLYLSSQLIHTTYFPHGVDFYGSFLGIKQNFVLNVFDDIDYLVNSDFFNKNKNILFKIDNFEHLFPNEKNKLEPIKINHNLTAKSQLSIQSIDNELFDDVFDDKSINLNDLKNMSIDLVELTNVQFLENNNSTNGQVTLKSNSTCSSRSSHTEEGDNICKEYYDNCNEDNIELENVDLDNEFDDNDDDNDDDEIINATIPKFPIQVICMENCENTFDELILNNDLTQEEWYSAFMQIIMILITYQKVFHFTHNDLHTSNVMYNKTDIKYLYYCYKSKYYKVPTYGRIFKIIDFGRSIYKFDGKLFCSDSFQAGGDAATQYNTEPYLNDKKPRLEPNYSFDLCRLACSIYDYLIEDPTEIIDLSKCSDPIKRLVVEWCLDDKGINMLYKNNGTDRYPDFKLYKMIARCVHNHTPHAQLERPEFKAFLFSGNFNNDNTNKGDRINIMKGECINIDEIPVCI